MKRILFFIVPIILLLSCGKEASILREYMNERNIPSQFVSVDVTRDTTITLQQGTKLIIPANSLKGKTNTVTLELKEVFTSQQIAEAGLFTKSDGLLLSSGGMLYIQAKEEGVIISKGITAKIPTAFADPQMQLYRGEVTDGDVNWVDPKPLRTELSPMVEKGKTLFMSNCASCHNPMKESTGPALYGTVQHWPSKKEAYDFIRNPSKYIASGNAYARCILDKYKVNMTAFPNLSDADLDALFAYVDREGKRSGMDTIKAKHTSYDSCKAMQQRIDALKGDIANARANRTQFIQLNYGAANGGTSVGLAVVERPEKDADTIMVDMDMYQQADYYNIEINAFGWYNIDKLMKDDPSFIEAELSVSLQGNVTDKIQLLLFIPGVQVMVPGYTSDGKSYTFMSRDGSIPLPKNERAIVMVIGEDRNKAQLYYGQTIFNTSNIGNIVVSMSPTDEKQMKASIASLSMQGVSAKIEADTTKLYLDKAVQKMYDLEHQFYDNCPCYVYPDIDTGYVSENEFR